MKVQCPACREIVKMERFVTSTEGLRFTCPDCEQLVFVANADNLDEERDSEATQATQPKQAAPTVAPAVPDEDQITCPKCGNTQADKDNCHRCGLNFLRFDPANLPPDPPEAVAAWKAVEADPDNLDLNKAFVEACNQAGRLDFAGRQYRLLGRDPAWTDLVERMRLRIATLAQAQLAPGGLQTSSANDPKRTSRIFMWVVLALSLAGFCYLIYISSDMLRDMV